MSESTLLRFSSLIKGFSDESRVNFGSADESGIWDNADIALGASGSADTTSSFGVPLPMEEAMADIFAIASGLDKTL